MSASSPAYPIVDVHAHAVSEKFLVDIGKRPIGGLTSIPDGKGGYLIRWQGQATASPLDPYLHALPRRIESLKRRNVQLQLFGPSPPFLSVVEGAANIELVRALHRQAVEIAGESEGLMEPMAIPALGEPEKAADELERTIDEYGFRSVMLASSAGGVPLDDPRFESLFACFEKRKLLVFMHPTTGFPPGRWGIPGLNFVLGWPFETTLAVTRLIFAGVFHRYPELKLVLGHGGGNLVFLRDRIDAAYHATGWEADPAYQRAITRRPSEYLGGLYYDTCTLGCDSARFVLDVMGEDRVLFGSDFPYEGVGDPEGALVMPLIKSLPAETQRKVLSENALRLLPRRTP